MDHPSIFLLTRPEPPTPMFTTKIDVLDLIINILTDHEKHLDELITRLEKVTPKAR